MRFTPFILLLLCCGCSPHVRVVEEYKIVDLRAAATGVPTDELTRHVEKTLNRYGAQGYRLVLINEGTAVFTIERAIKQDTP